MASPQASPAPAASLRPRRTFIEWREVPGLIRGALLGERRALRRILGARRGGRYGVMLASAAALVTVPPGALALTTIAWGVFGLGVSAAQRREPRLALREVLRLGLWTTAPLLVAAWPLRVLEGPAIPSFAAVALAYGLLGFWLARGLGEALEAGNNGELGNNGEGGR